MKKKDKDDSGEGHEAPLPAPPAAPYCAAHPEAAHTDQGCCAPGCTFVAVPK